MCIISIFSFILFILFYFFKIIFVTLGINNAEGFKNYTMLCKEAGMAVTPLSG